MVQGAKATIQGIVQGIGFRPFFYSLAKKHCLIGYILNTSSGVEIEVEGELDHIELFFKTIENNSLPLAHITSIERIDLPNLNYQDFVIRESIASAEKTALISPDICVCEDCLTEMRDPGDRRAIVTLLSTVPIADLDILSLKMSLMIDRKLRCKSSRSVKIASENMMIPTIGVFMLKPMLVPII